jgi:hypothetical protein
MFLLLGVSVGLILVSASAAQAQNASPIAALGRMQDIPGAHETPGTSETYKIIFDLSSTSTSAHRIGRAEVSATMAVAAEAAKHRAA